MTTLQILVARLEELEAALQKLESREPKQVEHDKIYLVVGSEQIDITDCNALINITAKIEYRINNIKKEISDTLYPKVILDETK